MTDDSWIVYVLLGNHCGVGDGGVGRKKTGLKRKFHGVCARDTARKGLKRYYFQNSSKTGHSKKDCLTPFSKRDQKESETVLPILVRVIDEKVAPICTVRIC